MTQLTGRASGLFESTFERDLRAIDRVGAAAVLKELEEGELGESFWAVTLPQRFDSSSVNNPQFRTFMASQVKAQATAFLSKHALVSSMIEVQDDIHHLVPKDYLRKKRGQRQARLQPGGQLRLCRNCGKYSNRQPHAL